MPKIMEYQFGKIIYVDCLDPEFGLPSLKDKSIELGFTDYPWGSNMKLNTRKYHNRFLNNDNNKYWYDDSESTNNQEFRLEWFFELDRVCKKTVLVIPEKHKRFWYRNTDPIADVPVLWKNGFSGSKVARKSFKSTYMFYGKFEKKKKLKKDYIAEVYYTKTTSIIPFTLKWGFCSDQKGYIHPSPKGIDLPLHLFKMLKPESILDPFAGSGSYLHAAEILGINWLGFEINEIYQVDIQRRFAQKTIERWI